MKVVIVGAGISGLTAAAALHQLGHEVIIYDTRHQIGGNCSDREMDDGTRLHMYGPHIFHTANSAVWSFLQKFTTFNNYSHRVVADTALGQIPIPYNLVSEKHTRKLTDQQIIELLFVDYSAKMWGLDWKYLPKEITERVPKRRDNKDCRYFTDEFQGIPGEGYQPMFENMAEGCMVRLASGRHAWKKESCDLLVYTGLVDEFVDFSLGRLSYKTLDITVREKQMGDYFPAAVLNQCNNKMYTRKADHSWWHGHEHNNVGMVTIEHPRDWESDDVPYYPIPFGEDQVLANQYANIRVGNNVIFLGRLATYNYLDIDKAVLQALNAVKQFT